MKGIDVSYHNGVIDWQKVKQSVDFAIIRAGYGKSTMDKQFINNICGAHTAGLKIGIYWFIYAANTDEAILNAKMCEKCIEGYKNIITMRAWADWEYDSDKRNPQTKEGRTNIVKAFCDYLSSKGYETGVYSNVDYLTSKFGDLSKYPLWLAKYSSNKGNYSPFMWQYSSKGRVEGISTYVDMNICYGDTVTENNKEATLFSLKENGNERVSQNFKVSEFRCKDGSDKILIDVDFVRNKLQAIRDHFNAPVTVNSAYRTPEYNSRPDVGGAKNSYHLQGRAFDIVVKGHTPLEVARYAQSLGIPGIIQYNGFVHVDSRPVRYWARNNNGEVTVRSSF